jgi:hypothetical protein
MEYKIISKQNRAMLVEWSDGLSNFHRSIVPSDAMPENLNELAAGIPFGVNWEDYLTDELANRLANRLRERGLWTYADAANNIRDFRAIVNEVVAASLLNAARGVK